jgi:hypothetical protein
MTEQEYRELIAAVANKKITIGEASRRIEKAKEARSRENQFSEKESNGG